MEDAFIAAGRKLQTLEDAMTKIAGHIYCDSAAAHEMSLIASRALKEVRAL